MKKKQIAAPLQQQSARLLIKEHPLTSLNQRPFKGIYNQAFKKEERKDPQTVISQNNKFLAIYSKKDPSNVLGFVIYKAFPSSNFIDYIAIAKNERRKGYGREVLHHLKETLRKPITLKIGTANEDTYKDRKDFYKKAGFSFITSGLMCSRPDLSEVEVNKIKTEIAA